MILVTGKSVEIPKDAVESTEALMKNANIADKLDDMTDGPIDGTSAIDGSIAKAIKRLTPHVDTIDIKK